VRKIIGNVEDLGEIWDTLDTCCERPEKYKTEALKPIVEFRRYKMADSSHQGILLHIESHYQECKNCGAPEAAYQ
jgi:hypothetical protein